MLQTCARSPRYGASVPTFVSVETRRVLKVCTRPSSCFQQAIVTPRVVGDVSVKTGKLYPDIPSDPGSDPDLEQLRASARWQKSVSYVSFWLQIALSVVSGAVLAFSVLVSPPGGGTAAATKWLTLVGVVFAFFSAFFAHGFLTLADKLLRGEAVRRSWIVGNLINVNNLNLLGIGATIIGLQASVGTLVSKTFMTSFQTAFAAPGQAGNVLVPLDMYALQASTNTLLSHFISLIFTNLLLRIVNKTKPAAA